MELLNPIDGALHALIIQRVLGYIQRTVENTVSKKLKQSLRQLEAANTTLFDITPCIQTLGLIAGLRG